MLAILSVVFTCVISCDDSLDEIFQESVQINREHLLKSIKITNNDSKVGKLYEFNYSQKQDTLLFINTTIVPGDDPEEGDDYQSPELKFEYNEDNGELKNFESLVEGQQGEEGIVYLDLLIPNPYNDPKPEFYVLEQDRYSNPTLLRMIVKEDEEVKLLYVNITYDTELNPYKPYLELAGVIEAADSKANISGRRQFFTSEFLPTFNPTNIEFWNENQLEHRYWFIPEYDEKYRITKANVYYKDDAQLHLSTKTVEYSYLDSTIK
ncbi:hypothetical protein [Galbibacter marinus]|uniref:hypothetical protein n=1 Tax=Galbibacter marinus TaxID=555500 RepID=UPI0012EA0955|nr:hypothetical protein [Galbibacter marinus]